MDHFPLDLNYTMKKKYKTTTLKKKALKVKTMILFKDFGMHTPVQINTFQVLNLFKGYKSMI